MNADGNMPYDICEDEVTLDFIESEMAKRGRNLLCLFLLFCYSFCPKGPLPSREIPCKALLYLLEVRGRLAG